MQIALCAANSAPQSPFEDLQVFLPFMFSLPVLYFKVNFLKKTKICFNSSVNIVVLVTTRFAPNGVAPVLTAFMTCCVIPVVVLVVVVVPLTVLFFLLQGYAV